MGLRKDLNVDDKEPIFALTMGDPNGCGPEIIAKMVSSDVSGGLPGLVCIGESQVMRSAFKIIGKACEIKPISSISQFHQDPNVLHIIDLKNVDHEAFRWGEMQAKAGKAAYEYITTAIDLALSGSVDGVVTAPICKEALHLADLKFDGHTEIFTKRTQSRSTAMMLASGHFRVTHVSTHVSLKEAIARCKTERILDVIRLTNQGIQKMGVDDPKLAVAGLNPHSGEGGTFGWEEIEEIQPAIDQARREGLEVNPYPVSPDTVFNRMLERREFDAVVAQYHDQGHIAAKVYDFWGGVNITLGLPIIRTSVDHGTAFDIAGTGKADPTSLINAIKFGQLLYTHWNERNSKWAR
jgi:4-hydroxythreonine-4-phosphate dehydrogenase